MTRRTRGHRAGRIAGVGLLVGGAAIAVWGVPIAADRVAAVVDPDQPVRVRAAHARVALRPFPTIVASGVRLSFDDRVQVEFSSVAIGLGLRSLLAGETVWTRVRLAGGRLGVEPTSGAVPMRCVSMRGRAVAVGATGARVDVSGECATGRVSLGIVRYRGEVDWRRPGAPRSTGRLRSDGPVLAGVEGSALVATIRAGADGLRADDVRLAIGGGTIAGRGRWLRRGDRRRVAFALEGSGSDAGQAFDEAALRIAGRWVAQGRGRAAGPADVPLARRASGHGRLVLVDGSIEPLDVGDALLDGLEVWRGRRRQRLRRRFPDVFGGERLRYDRAVVNVHARRGRYELAPIRVRSRSYRADGHGRLGRDGLVAGEIRVVPNEELSDALIGRGALRAIVAGDRQEIVLPVQVTGRPESLAVRPAPAFAREVLERALGGSVLGRALDRLLSR